MNINKRIPYISRLLKNSHFTTKVRIFMSYKTAGADYDPREKNYTESNLNPITIKGYATQLSPSALVWKSEGLQEQGAIEIVTEKKYRNWFEKCAKVEVNSENYQVFKEGTGGRAIITDRPFQLIRVVLQKIKSD